MNSASSDRRWLVLGICCMSLLIVELDTTIVTVALPAIHRSLHASLAGLQWIIDAYTLVLGSLLMLGGSTELLFASYVMVGIGLGLINPPITNTAISGMPPAQAGVAAAVASTCRQVGSTIGIAVSGAVVSAGSGVIDGSGFAHATHSGWWLMVGFAAVMFIIGALTTTTWAFATERATAARLELEVAPS